MRRLMNLVILVALSLILVVVWSSKLLGGITQVHAWGIGSGVIAISPDGKFLAASAGPTQERKFGNIPIYGSTTVKLYTFPSGEVVRTLEAFYVTRIAFSPDSSLIAAGNKAGEIMIWRGSDGQLLYQRKASVIRPEPWYGYYSEEVHTLFFSQDGQTLVTGAWGQFDVWQVADGQLRYTISHKYQRSGDISSDGKILALTNPDKNVITFYHLCDGSPISEANFYGFPKFSPDGQKIALSVFNDGQKKISLYRLKDDTLLSTLVVEDLESSLAHFVFSTYGRYVAATYRTGGYRGSVLVIPDSMSPERWHLAVWRLDDKPYKYVYPMTIQSKAKVFTAVAFSPDSKILVTGGDKIRLWRVP